MQRTAHYHLVLHHDSHSAALEALFADDGADSVLQMTRITSAFSSRLLRVDRGLGRMGEDFAISSAQRQYIWEVDAVLVTSAPYDFEGNAERLQARVAGLATVYRIDCFTTPAGGE
jgi:hypothetical protein